MKTIILAVTLSLWVATGYGGPLAGRLTSPSFAAFSRPFDFAPAADGEVVVLEGQPGRVMRGRPNAAPVAVDALNQPLTVARDPDGLLHVVDTLDTEEGGGALGLRTFRADPPAQPVPLQGDAVPKQPVSAAAGDGILWLVERTPPRLHLYAYDGTSLGWVDLAQVARAPFGIALGPSGEAFVTDPLGPAVLSFSPTGELLGKLSLEGTGITRPTGIAVDSSGRVWVSDGVIGHVTALEPGGAHSKLEERGSLLRFGSPLRLAWQPGALWVLEADSGRVRIVELE